MPDDINARLDKIDESLAALGAEIGAALNAAARKASRHLRSTDGPHSHRYGNADGRSRAEVVAILNRFGHTLTA